jgi:hypothetical protein
LKAYKFLTADGLGVFSRFAWPLPNAGAGAWVESEVEPCRAGIHACRQIDLPYWLAPALYEIELDGAVDEQPTKLVAPRGRLIRRIDGWDDVTQNAYAQMCLARASELVAVAPARLAAWAPTPEQPLGGPALLGFIAATIAQQLDGVEAHLDERKRQSEWLVERLALASPSI